MSAAHPFRRIALTGGIATGKSYCLMKFAELGAPTISADVLARQAVSPGTAGFEQVVSRFGEAILTGDGLLDRSALAAIVFADADARRALEAIVHPVVYRAIERWFSTMERPGRVHAAIADIPLLFETGHESDFDKVIVAACPAGLQRSRLISRDQLSEAEADRRLASQMPIDEKIRRADYVIDTSGAFEDTDSQVRKIWSQLDGDAGAAPKSTPG